MASNDNNAGNGANTPNSSRRQFLPRRSTSSLPYAEWVEALGLPRIPSPPLNNTDREVNEQHEDAVFNSAVRLNRL